MYGILKSDRLRGGIGMAQKVKWGVLGTADIAQSCTIPGMQLDKNCELVAIAGRNPEKVKKFQERFGFHRGYCSYGELLEDPEIEAVYIPLPNHLHYEWVINALEAGKHVLCEKPLGGNEEQVRKMFACAKKHGVFLMEAFAYLHSPWIRAVKQELDSGIIGEPVYMESQFLTSDYDLNNIRMHKESLGGSVYDLGCYSTSMILWMLGEEPSEVQAVAQFTPQGVDSLATGILSFDSGKKAMFTCGMALSGSRSKRLDRFYIHGTNGNIRSDYEFNECGEIQYTVTVEDERTVHIVTAPQNYSLEVIQLGECIRGKATPYISEEFSLLNARTIDRILTQIRY